MSGGEWLSGVAMSRQLLFNRGFDMGQNNTPARQ